MAQRLGGLALSRARGWGGRVTAPVRNPLATRIPKTLHRQLKLHCVRADTSLMDFVVEALREKLTRESSRRRTSRSGT